MKNERLYYLIGITALALGFFQLTKQDHWEFAMYCSTGLAFISTALSMREWKEDLIRKTLAIASWIFIILAVFLFLFLMRTDFT